MYQHHEALQAVRTVTKSNHDGYPKAASVPSPSARRIDSPTHLRIVAAPGGVAFVRDAPGETRPSGIEARGKGGIA